MLQPHRKTIVDTLDEDLLRVEYERCNPGDTLDALVHRAAFSKEDRRRLEDWRAAIRAGLASRS